ncbi:hypothetical protein [Rothia terrae]|uniref:Uncharacterized protein n=1 Tax=Rothia terrae TaxID=396015 RepID=A0A7S6WWB2_9MICC|nr:hypothetical protein [Rothia terrae]QOW64695.1 hypothetical protein IDM49_11370 [Rothia terrae]
MGASETGIRKTKRNGKSQGVMFTAKDIERTRNLARWYTLPVSILVRAELDRKYWIGGKNSLKDTEEAHKKIASLDRGIRRRLQTLRNIEANNYIGLGPAIGTVSLNPELGSSAGVGSSHYCTRYGANMFNLGWDIRSTINPMFAAHAFMAASVGISIEALGIKVYSEREFTSGIDKNGNRIEENFKSTYTSSSGNTVGKEPDLVIPAPDGKHFIAVECERKKNRKPKEYADKIEAYRDNPNVVAVWYFCENETVGSHIVEGANTALNYDTETMPCRAMLIKSTEGYYELPMTTREFQPFVQDLRKLRDQFPAR